MTASLRNVGRVVRATTAIGTTAPKRASGLVARAAATIELIDAAHQRRLREDWVPLAVRNACRRPTRWGASRRTIPDRNIAVGI